LHDIRLWGGICEQAKLTLGALAWKFDSGRSWIRVRRLM
jgi:hypothetical protein